MKAAENMHIKGKVPKAGLIFGDSLTWEAVGTPACSGHPQPPTDMVAIGCSPNNLIQLLLSFFMPVTENNKINCE